ncbi:MAG: amidoligase family protein [Clostridia bacterium]|nr:amidoligase family protein [Clostridia bacterium]
MHIGANYLSNGKSIENLLELWGDNEKILYIISNKENEVPREGIIKYASPISSNIEELLKNNSVELNTEEDLKEFAMKSQNMDRYYGINFMNLNNSKNTIEFRLPNGTIDENTWIENINLFGGIIKSAEDIMQIQCKPENERIDEENKKIALFERLKDKELSDEERLETLLSLVIREENRDIYRNRYKTNSELIRQNSELLDGITKNIAKSPVNIKKISKTVFVGEGSVTGQDYQKIKSDIEKYKQKENQEVIE